MSRRRWRHVAGATLVVALATVVPVTGATAAATPQSIAASILSVPLTGGGTIVTGVQAVVSLTPATDVIQFTVSGVGARYFRLVAPSDTGFVVGSDADVAVTTSTVTPTGVPGHMSLGTFYGEPVCPAPDTSATVTITRADRDGAGLLTSLSGHLHLGCPDTGATYEVEVRYASPDPVVALAFLGETVIADPAQPGVPPTAGTSGVTLAKVRNAGSEPVTLGSFTVAAADPGWTMTVDPGTCSAASVLAPGASCLVHVSWTSDGMPTTAQLTVSSPDAQASSIATTLRTNGTPAAPTVLSGRDAVDGVALSWRFAQGYPLPTLYDVYRRTGIGGWELVASALTTPRYADVALAPGQSADYQVRGRSTLGWASGPGDGNIVTAARLTSTPAYDPAVQIEQVSTPARSVVAGRYFSVTPVVTAPGVYDVPGDVTARTFSDNGIVCGSPKGTLTVRDVVTSATGVYLRIDWSFRGTCADGTPVAEELRVGVPGTPFAALDVARVENEWQLPPQGTYVGQSSLFALRVTNRSTSPVVIPRATLDPGGSSASWFSNQGECGVTLQPQTSCTEVWTVRPRSAWSGNAQLHLSGVGLLGDTVSTLTVVAKPDSVTPTLTIEPAGPFADDRSLPVNARWTDAQSGPGTEDIRIRTATLGQTSLGPWLYPRDGQNVDANGYGYSVVPQHGLEPGVETCLSFRARDLAGNVTPWSGPRCQSTAVDDLTLMPRQGGTVWRNYSTALTLSNNGTYQGATRRGAALVGPTVHARQIALLGVACPTCGTVSVYIGHTKVGSFSTRSKAWHHRAWFVTPLYGRVQNGVISFVVTSSGKPVYIDGFSVRLV